MGIAEKFQKFMAECKEVCNVKKDPWLEWAITIFVHRHCARLPELQQTLHDLYHCWEWMDSFFESALQGMTLKEVKSWHLVFAQIVNLRVTLLFTLSEDKYVYTPLELSVFKLAADRLAKCAQQSEWDKDQLFNELTIIIRDLESLERKG